MENITKLEWIKKVQNASYTSEDTKQWIAHLFKAGLDIDKIHEMVLWDLHDTWDEIVLRDLRQLHKEEKIRTFPR